MQLLIRRGQEKTPRLSRWSCSALLTLGDLQHSCCGRRGLVFPCGSPAFCCSELHSWGCSSPPENQGGPFSLLTHVFLFLVTSFTLSLWSFSRFIPPFSFLAVERAELRCAVPPVGLYSGIVVFSVLFCMPSPLIPG